MTGRRLYIVLFFFLFSFPFSAQEKEVLDLKLERKSLPFGLNCYESSYLPKISLALSGGGARGISQLGVLKAFVENDIRISKIAGTSMGSIIGGLFASGYTIDELDSIIVNAPWEDFFTFEETNRNELFVDQKITEDKAIFSLRLDGFKPVIPTAINTGQRVSNFLNLLSLNAPIRSTASFNNLLIPFSAVSTNLLNGEKIVIDDGSLSLAMRASSSVSLVLEPVKIDSMILVDGGIVENIPVFTALKNSDFVIAVDATSPLRDESELRFPWEIADQLVSIPTKKSNERQLDSADFIITPDLKGTKNTNFVNLKEIINDGYNAAIPVIDRIREKEMEFFKRRLPFEEFELNNLSLSSNNKKLEMHLREKVGNYETVTNKDLIYLISTYEELNKFRHIKPELTIYPNSGKLEVIVTENPLIKSVTVKGAELLDTLEIIKITNKLEGHSYNAEKVLTIVLEILKLYREKGYSLIDVDDITFDENRNELSIQIREQKIDRIRAVGNKKTYFKNVARELPLSEGDYFEYEKLRRGLINLRSSDLFETIEVKLEEENDRNILIVEVTEKPSQLLRLGVRIDNEYFTQLSVDLRDENFLGSATELGAIISGGLRNSSVIFEHQASRVFDTYLTYEIKGFYEQRDINTYTESPDNTNTRFKRISSGEYTQSFFGGSLGIGSQIEKFGNVMIEGKYQQDKVKNKEDFPSSSEYTTNIASLKFILAIDSQDKYPYPNEGFLVNGYYETAQSSFGGDVSYAKFYMNYNSYFTLNNMHNFAARFTVGFADETLPLSQQFSFGGQHNFFGYREYGLRGRQIFVSSLEYRALLPVKLFFDTYIKARYDLGSIWSEQEAIRFKDLRHGIGATLSLDTPIGPADFSVGRSFIIKNKIPDNTVSWGETTFYFTIGYYY